jgi:hypothetical protein
MMQPQLLQLYRIYSGEISSSHTQAEHTLPRMQHTLLSLSQLLLKLMASYLRCGGVDQHIGSVTMSISTCYGYCNVERIFSKAPMMSQGVSYHAIG